MNIERSDLERRVMAQHRILHVLIAHVAASTAEALGQLEADFNQACSSHADWDDKRWTEDCAHWFMRRVAMLRESSGLSNTRSGIEFAVNQMSYVDKPHLAAADGDRSVSADRPSTAAESWFVFDAHINQTERRRGLAD